MNESPLQLHRHFFTEVSLKANPGGRMQNPCDSNVDFACNATVRTETETHWEVKVLLRIASKNLSEPYAYEVRMEIEGFFVFQHQTPPLQDPDVLANVNSVGILYGAAREMLITLSARLPHGAISVPSLSFVDAVRRVPTPTS